MLESTGKDVNRNSRHVLEIYDQLQIIPTKDQDYQLTKYCFIHIFSLNYNRIRCFTNYLRFCELVKKSDPKELLSWKEFQEVSTECADITVIHEKVKERRRVVRLKTQKDVVNLLEYQNNVRSLFYFCYFNFFLTLFTNRLNF